MYNAAPDPNNASDCVMCVCASGCLCACLCLSVTESKRNYVQRCIRSQQRLSVYVCLRLRLFMWLLVSVRNQICLSEKGAITGGQNVNIFVFVSETDTRQHLMTSGGVMTA